MFVYVCNLAVMTGSFQEFSSVKESCMLPLNCCMNVYKHSSVVDLSHHANRENPFLLSHVVSSNYYISIMSFLDHVIP